jgi:hypothetical protein
MPVGLVSGPSFRPPFGTSGVGHDEQPFAAMAGADFRRAE